MEKLGSQSLKEMPSQDRSWSQSLRQALPSVSPKSPITYHELDGEDSQSEESHIDRTTTPPTWLARYSKIVIAMLALTLTGTISILGLTLARGQALIPTSSGGLHSIRNSTLGFQKIYSIGLPGKTHKHDTQVMGGEYTGLKIDFEPGVYWKDVPVSEITEHWSLEGTYVAGIGCWRAHMNLIAKIVEEGIQSALILEDDADWDVQIKSQLQSVAEGALALQKSTSMQSGSPYGPDWDLLWVGACELDAPKYDDEYYVIENDTTVPPVWHRFVQWHGTDKVPLENTRYVFRNGYGVCTTGYAITLEGARRILTGNSVQLPFDAIDRQYGTMCSGTDTSMPPLRCLAVYPPLIGMHRFGGSNVRDSDITTPEEIVWHPEYTYDVLYSTAMNIPRIAWGNTTAKSQWDEDGIVPETVLDTEYRLKGSIQHISDSTP